MLCTCLKSSLTDVCLTQLHAALASWQSLQQLQGFDCRWARSFGWLVGCDGVTLIELNVSRERAEGGDVIDCIC